MGGSASIAQRYKTKESNNSWSAILSANNNFFVSADGHNEKIWKLMMPIYYSNEVINESHVVLLKLTWTHISQNTSPVFLQSKNTLKPEDFPYENTLDWFGKLFYRRFFDIHPQSIHWFSDPNKQSKALVGFLNLGLSAFDNKKAFRDNLIALTTIHVKRGIKAPSYGPFGEALFWTLRFCLGEQIYDEQAHRAWVILYSMMIRIMVGKTVELELKAKNASKKSDVTDKHEEVPHHFETYSYKASFIDPVYERA